MTDEEIKAEAKRIANTLYANNNELAAAILRLCESVREEQQKEIGRAVDLIHTENDYDQGMQLLCRLAGRKDKWPADVKTISVQELASRATQGVAGDD